MSNPALFSLQCSQPSEFFFHDSSQPVGPSIPDDFYSSFHAQPACNSGEERGMTVKEWTVSNALLIQEKLKEKLGDSIKFPKNPISRSGNFRFTYEKGAIKENVILSCQNRKSMISLINRTSALFDLLSKEPGIYEHYLGFRIFSDQKSKSYIKVKYEIADEEIHENVYLNSAFSKDIKGNFMFNGKKLHDQIINIFNRIEEEFKMLPLKDERHKNRLVFLRTQSQSMAGFSSQGLFLEQELFNSEEDSPVEEPESKDISTQDLIESQESINSKGELDYKQLSELAQGLLESDNEEQQSTHSSAAQRPRKRQRF